MTVVALAGAALLALPAGAVADDDDPRIYGAVVIEGTPQVGTELTAHARWRGEEAVYTWLRCDAEEDWDCDNVAAGEQYLLTGEDLGSRMRVRLTVWGEDDDDDVTRRSELTGVVAAAPPVEEPEEPEEPEQPEEPEEPVDPPPTDPPPVDLAPEPPAPAPVAPTPLRPAGEVLGGSERRAVLLRPFPVVRIKGWLTDRGAMFRLLTVRAPRGTRITVRCRGRACPRKRWARRRKQMVTRVTPFQRDLRAGTRLIVRVTRKGRIGKHTVIRVRKGEAPARRDRCLFPGSRKPRKCPGGE